jgi:putative tryptophan/tyrosine transport system substrate-binding protein
LSEQNLVSGRRCAPWSRFQEGVIMTALAYVKRQRWERPATIGFLGATKQSAWSEFIAPFERQLREQGWISGHNLEIDYRWADGQTDRCEKIAKDFADKGVDVIVTAGTSAVAAARKATKTVPIVFAAAGDPAHTGLVHSLAHPGGNVTGLSNGQTDLAGKRLQLLHQAVPGMKKLGILGNRGSANVRLEIAALEKAARKLKIETTIRDIRREPQIASAIRGLKGKVDALYVCTDPFVTHHQIGINTLAAGAGLPTMQAFRHHIEAGGLIAYGPDFRDLFRDAADIVDKILRGSKPADIPVKLAKRCHLVVNPHTAKALGLRLPKGLRRRAEAVR